MYRPVCSQLILIILLALQLITSLNSTNSLLAHKYSVEEQIHIDGLYVERDANGDGIYARVDRYTSTKLSPKKDREGGEIHQQQQGHKYHHPGNDQHHHVNLVAQPEQLQQAVHDHHYLMQQQEHHHQLQQKQQQRPLHNQQQVPQAQKKHPHQQGQQQLQHEHQQLQRDLHHHQQQQHLHHHQSNHNQPEAAKVQQPNQGQQQQVSHQQQQEQQYQYAYDFQDGAQHHSPHELQHQQHSHQLQLQYLYQQHHQQIQSHIHQHTQIEWRSESIHDLGAGGVGISELYMHNFETTYPIAVDDHLSQHHSHPSQQHPLHQHHASSCDPIDDSSILMMPSEFRREPTCQATSATGFSAGSASGHVPKFAPHNKPSQNSNVESFPLVPQPYQYDSSLMTAIRHYWREISGLCLASAIFLNWLFVVVKRRFFASSLARSRLLSEITDSCEHIRDSTHQQRLSSSSSTTTSPKSGSKDTTATCSNSAQDSAFEENASPVSLDDADDTSQESSLSSRPHSISSSPFGATISQPSSSLNSSSYTSDYVSRYSSDFDSIRRLGRGGFGIVFEAKNKIDDCHYAVKRICLPLEKEARERVMREVRALAKLDHAGIVRYYNAWLETPPDDWLKQHDALLGIVHTRDGLNFASTDGIYERNDSDLTTNKKGVNIGDKFGESGDISNMDFFGNAKSPFDNKNRTNGYSSDYLKENSSSPSLDIVFEGSGSIRLETENNTEESEMKVVASSGLHLEKVYLYIQMQLCRKDTLKDWLRTNCENRDKTTIFDFFYQIVDAVEYVHSQDLIHRDLKPSNIFFSLDGTLKIGDFGLCRAKTTNCVGSSLDLKEYNVDLAETVHTEAVGTQLYMSPEQMNGLSYNHKVDIFAMGLILLELLVPFKTQMQRVNVLLKARKNMFSRDFMRDHPDEHDLVRSLLDRRPHKRPTASAIKEHDLLANAQLSQPVIERIYHRRRTISSNSSSE